MKKILALCILFLFAMPVNAKSIIEYKTSKQICDAVKGKTITIGKDVYKSNSQTLASKSGTCENANSVFGMQDIANTVKVSGIVVKDANKYSASGFGEYEYSYFYLDNSKGGPLETIYFKIDLDNKNIKGNTYKDLRLKFKASSNVYLEDYNTVVYYLETKDSNGKARTYGPYGLYDYQANNVYKEITSEKTLTLNVNDYVSENLVKDVPATDKIIGIKVLPYGNYHRNSGIFKVFNMSLEGYTDGYVGNKRVSVGSANNTVRHNIVNNFMNSITLKWDISDKSTRDMNVYYIDGKVKLELSKNNKNIYYGMPYTTSHVLKGSTYSFLSQTDKGTSKNGAYYSYKITDKWLLTTKMSNGKEIIKGEAADSTLYVFNSEKDAETIKKNLLAKSADFWKEAVYTKKEVESHDFINSKGGYLEGFSCSTEVTNASATELPIDALSSYSYVLNHTDVKLIGGLSVSLKEVSDILRDENKLNANEYLTLDKYYASYTSIIKNKYSAQEVYNAYASTRPGDTISHPGHVRLVTGYPIVECNNKDSNGKTVIYSAGSYSSTKNCDKYGGINPKKSYVITGEGGRAYKDRTSEEYKDSGGGIPASSKEAGWTVTLDSKYTDITNIDEIYNKTARPSSRKTINTIARPNLKYSFEILYGGTKYEYYFLNKKDRPVAGTDKIKNMYLPYRFKETNEIKEKNTVIVPNVRLVLEKDYSNTGSELYNYLVKKHKLRGYIFSNYLIEAIKFTINNKDYYFYPHQTRSISLSSDITDTNITKALKSAKTVTISVKSGPNIEKVQGSSGAKATKDKKTGDYYIKVVDIKNYSTPTPTVSANEDVNADGKIDNLDYVLVRNHIRGTTKLTGDKLERADINKDNKINNMDYVLIRNIIRGTIKPSYSNSRSNSFSGIFFDESSVIIEVGEKDSLVLINAEGQKITWTSSNSKVVKVSDGDIVGLKVGEATVTATASNGTKASIKVTVNASIANFEEKDKEEETG